MKSIRSAILMCLCVSVIAWGQSTGQIHGTVQDPSGAGIPGAEVRATQSETGVSRSVPTDATGGFVLPNLPLGTYRVEISKEGFATAINGGIQLEVGSDPAVNVTLKIGAASERVTVEANAALVETRSLGVGEVIQTQRIVDLPLNGRNVTDLISLAGASVQTGTTQSRWFSNSRSSASGDRPRWGEPAEPRFLAPSTASTEPII